LHPIYCVHELVGILLKWQRMACLNLSGYKHHLLKSDYYEGSQWAMPLVCCVCLRWQHGVKMHSIVVNANEEIPAYLSILRNSYGSPFSDDEFQFMDTHLNGLMLDLEGLQSCEECATLLVCHPCNGYLPRSLMPRYALANKLYHGCLPEEFRNLMWIEEQVCVKYSSTAVVTRLYQSSDPSHYVRWAI